MNRSSNSPNQRPLRGLMVAALALFSLASGAVAEAQSYCQEWTSTLLALNQNCVSSPIRDRAFGGQTFTWKGEDYLVFSRGNELSIYQLGNTPAYPTRVADSRFGFGTAGDSDYDIMFFDVCDECRYMVMDHKVAGTVVVDLGTGSEPKFSTYSRQGISSTGSTVFSHAGQEYIVAGKLEPSCGNASALFAINTTNDLQFLQCIQADSENVLLGGGKALHTGSDTHLYLGDDDGGDVYVYKVNGSGTGATLTHTATPPGMKGREYELSLAPNHMIGASADFHGRRVLFWDLSNPGNPVQKTDWTLSSITASMVDIKSASSSTPLVLWVAGIGWLNSTNTFLIEETGPEPFDNGFWSDTSEPHNSFLSCTLDMGGALAPDGSTLYLSRYATQQVFDLSQCLGPTAAVASVLATPSTVFPGDAVTVSDRTVGSYDRWALWVEKNGSYEAGDQTPSGTNPHSFDFTVPKDVAEGEDFTAHIAVESDDLPAAQAANSTSITINRAPAASYTITPDAAVVGDTVTLSATAEGNPSDTDPFNWTITRPSTANTFLTGPTVQVNLNESGQWTFILRVDYDHGASGATADPDSDSKYEVLVTQVLNVSSVAADFTVSPPVPVHNQTILLDASLSKGNISSYNWLLHGPTDRGADGISASDYTGCADAEQCSIPGETLEWGHYTVTLGVANDLGDSNETVKYIDVRNGAVQPTSRWSPVSPEIGETVIFSIDGVYVDVDKATWTMGGVGCDNDSATQVCTPSLFQDCKALPFKYASGGAKVVGLSVEIEGVTYTDSRPASERTVTVASTGSCGAPPTCEYNLSPSSTVFSAGGGTRSFAVLATSGCSWTASESESWITITSGASGTGNRTVYYSVAANPGARRVGNISVGGRSYTITQSAPLVPLDFDFSKIYPKIGETVTFSADPALEIDHWDFGDVNCDGQNPVKDCFWLPAGACNEVEWTFSTPGVKNVTMVLTDGRVKIKHPTVQNVGECCYADGTPRASFDGPSEVYAGQEVTFADSSTKSIAATKALGANWTPMEPEIGEQITFTLTGLTGSVGKATWEFGETGCDGEAAVKECISGIFNNCSGMTFTYASGGAKTVSVSVELEGGGTQTVGPLAIDVANSGSCDSGGGGGGCSYSLTPISAQFDFESGSGGFNVTTTEECAWEATTTSSWIDVTSGSGTGSGSVTYTVQENQLTSSRTGYVRVEGRSHTVRQNPPEVEVDRDPTAWQWTVYRVNDFGGLEAIATSDQQNLVYVFESAGVYQVVLEASNCMGSSEYGKGVTVVDSPIEDWVFGATVSLAGANETQWESDLRFFNPCAEPLDVRIEYEPEGENNTEAELVFREFLLQADQTRVFANIIEAIPSLAEEELSGSMRIESASDSGCMVLSVSRTFNDTPEGSLGLFVPALPVKRNTANFLDLTGLMSNADYRTNLRLVNFSDTDAWVPLKLYAQNGDQIGGSRSVMVHGHSTKQINEIAAWLGVEGDIAPFSVRAEITGVEVQAFATVVDNLTGDSVLYLSSFTGMNKIWLAGVANLEGVNNSQWRTDVWLYNPTEDWLGGQVEFVVGDNPGDIYGFEWPTMGANRVKKYLDIVGDQIGLEETRGYLVLTGADGGPAPQIAARTYNLDLAGGTYGLNLRAFTEDDLLLPGDTAYIAGISNSADLSVGFRTNLGLLNTDRDRWTGVRVTLYGLDGTAVAEPWETLIAPGVMRQLDIFKRLGLEGTNMTGSIKIEVTEGGGIAAYATEIDNRTQDSIFIPAQQKFIGAAR